MFQFKKFSINHQKSAMKVGTDAVLLGAWATIDNDPFSILDIGAGTGLLALMLAQRTNAEQIDAIEIDAAAYEECVENFEESPWNDRLFCYHASLDDFMDDLEDEEYDLIISNPPFYKDSFPSGDKQRDTARMEYALPFSDLIEAASVLLSDIGILCVVIPFTSEEDFIALALDNELHLQKKTHVKGMPDSEIKRSLLAFGRVEAEAITEDVLVIETARHEYTPAYKALTRDFYIKME